jgi:hypothetical protein
VASIPTDDQIRARAEELKLLEPGADLSPQIRRTVAKVLLDEAQAPPPPRAAFEPVLLSRVTQPSSGGMIRVDVLFIPNPPQEGTTP